MKWVVGNGYKDEDYGAQISADPNKKVYLNIYASHIDNATACDIYYNMKWTVYIRYNELQMLPQAS